MKKVLFVCAAGMSTSLLVNKTMDAVVKAGKENELTFFANSVAVAEKDIPEADCVLVAPQVRFQLNALQKKFPTQKFALIPPRVYGMCDGPEIIKLAEQTMK